MKTIGVVITKDRLEPECEAALLRQGIPYLVSVVPAENLSNDSTKNLYLNCAKNRNIARRMALAIDAERYLFLDSDIVLPDGAIENFSLQSKEILGGWYRQRNSDRWVAGCWVADNVFRHYLAPQPSLVQTDLVGMGCCWISREALEEIEFNPGMNSAGEWLYDSNGLLLGECAMFGNYAAAKGYQLYMDGSVVCEHVERR